MRPSASDVDQFIKLAIGEAFLIMAHLLHESVADRDFKRQCVNAVIFPGDRNKMVNRTTAQETILAHRQRLINRDEHARAREVCYDALMISLSGHERGRQAQSQARG